MLEKIEQAIAEKQTEIDELKEHKYNKELISAVEGDVILLQEIRDFINKNCLICTDMEG